MDNQIICPNCGAPNESTSTSCQFCGASLVATKKNKEEENEKNEPSSEVSVREIKGKPQIKFDKRIFHLKYFEFNDTAELVISYQITSVCDWDCRYSISYSFTLNQLQISGIKNIISDGKKYDCPDDMYIGTDNLDILETFCNLDWKNCKVDGAEGKGILFVLICQAFYNTIFDHSKYTDATDKLYEYYLQCIAQENKEKEEKLRETREYFKKERIKGCLAFSIIIILSLLGLGLPFFLAHIFD